jgi:hypothetical protein
MKTSDKEIKFVAIFVLAWGAVLMASGLGGLVEAAREHPAVSRFLLGYSFLWAAVGMLIQRSNRKLFINRIGVFTQSPPKSRHE